jgi:hypothetical protein
MIQRDDKDPNDCATQPHDITHICLTGDTMVRLIDKSVPISSLIGKTGAIKCYDVYSNIETTSQFYNAQMTSEKADIIEIEFEDGTKVKCTENHPFLTKRGWIKAVDLTSVDDIVTT